VTPAPKTYPIVLAHGIARFDALLRATIPDAHMWADATHYFRRIRSTLEAENFVVHYSVVPWAASVAERAAALWQSIEGIGASKVHVIAHSMGGLDARHMLYDFRDAGAPDRVVSLTTIGTPHLGTSFADWGLELGGHDLLAVLNLLGIEGLDGFRDLTRDACAAFDQRARSFEESSGVQFRTYAGIQPLRTTFAPLKFSWLVIRERDGVRDGGANDGLVPLYSARWRASYFRRVVDADHLNQIGWSDLDELNRPFFPLTSRDDLGRSAVEERVRSLYLEIARKLAARFPLVA
jgi:triacylglycerol lipase